MTTLATSFAIGNFLARDSGACLGFQAFGRANSVFGRPFGKENNYVCQKRTCDPKLSVFTRRHSFPLGSRWCWCVFTQLGLRTTCSTSLILPSTGTRGAEPTGTRHRTASHTPHRSPLGVAASLSGLPLPTGAYSGSVCEGSHEPHRENRPPQRGMSISKRSRWRPAPSKFDGSSHCSSAARTPRHSSSMIENHAVSRFRPFMTIACRKVPS